MFLHLRTTPFEGMLDIDCKPSKVDATLVLPAFVAAVDTPVWTREIPHAATPANPAVLLSDVHLLAAVGEVPSPRSA